MDGYSFSSFSKEMADLGPLDKCQLAGCCCVYAVLSCIRECLRRDGNNGVPSLQDVIACCLSKGDSNNGWLVRDVLQFVLEHGLAWESDYPFTGDRDKCFRHKRELNQPEIIPRIHIEGFEVEAVKKATAVHQLKRLLRLHRVVVVTLFVGKEFGGPSIPPLLDVNGLFVHVRARADRERKVFGHAIMIIEHNYIKTSGYWLAKNWYGSEWGEAGYIKIADKCTYLFDEVAFLIGVSSV